MLTALVLIPLVAALLSGFAKTPARTTALIAAILNLVLAACAINAYGTACPAVEASNIFHFTLGLGHGIQVVMLLLTVIVTLAAVIGTKEPEGSGSLWYNSTLLISAGAIGAFLSDNIIGFFSFHELALIPTFLMIGMYGRGNKRSIAWRTTIYLGFGSMVLLAGLVLLYMNTTVIYFSELSSNMEAINNAPVISGLLLMGFGTLISLFPFHSWAAPAYASAPAPVAMMHAGVLKKFGLYALLLFTTSLPSGFFSFWLIPLIVLLCGNVLWVGWVTINQKRVDLMLGNSSVMHMGYIFLAIAALIAAGGYENNMIAFKGATMLILGHGLSIALLFLLCGAIERSTKTLEFACLGGLATKLPKLAFIFGLGAMASIGLPGFANFPGEFLTFFSGFQNWDWTTMSLGPVQIATVICLWGLVISAVYMLRAYKNIFQSSTSRSCETARPVDCATRLAATILCFALIIIGLYPNCILNILH